MWEGFTNKDKTEGRNAADFQVGKKAAEREGNNPALQALRDGERDHGCKRECGIDPSRNAPGRRQHRETWRLVPLWGLEGQGGLALRSVPRATPASHTLCGHSQAGQGTSGTPGTSAQSSGTSRCGAWSAGPHSRRTSAPSQPGCASRDGRGICSQCYRWQAV